jgi:hypothetical protein
MQRSGVSRLKLLGRHCSNAETAAQGRSQRRGQRRRARLCANTAIASPKARGRFRGPRPDTTAVRAAQRRQLTSGGGGGGHYAEAAADDPDRARGRCPYDRVHQ